jgi:hypothetical protein
MLSEEALRALHAEVVSALQIAVTRGAPNDLLGELATTAGLLAALVGMPPQALEAEVVRHAKVGLARWVAWQTATWRDLTAA